jgi:hypothetical protein
MNERYGSQILEKRLDEKRAQHNEDRTNRTENGVDEMQEQAFAMQQQHSPKYLLQRHKRMHGIFLGLFTVELYVRRLACPRPFQHVTAFVEKRVLKHRKPIFNPTETARRPIVRVIEWPERGQLPIMAVKMVGVPAWIGNSSRSLCVHLAALVRGTRRLHENKIIMMLEAVRADLLFRRWIVPHTEQA